MPQDPLCASSNLNLQWARVRKTGTWAKAESQYSWFCVISHTARLISVSVAHSLLQFKSANGGLQCLCSAAYTWHQICPLGTHSCLQETSTHPFQDRPHNIIVFPGLFRAILCHILSLLNIKIWLLWPMQWLQMVISYKQEPPILLLHCTEQTSSKQLPPHFHRSEMHIFTQLTLSPQLIIGQVNIRATQQQV